MWSWDPARPQASEVRLLTSGSGSVSRSWLMFPYKLVCLDQKVGS